MSTVTFCFHNPNRVKERKPSVLFDETRKMVTMYGEGISTPDEIVRPHPTHPWIVEVYRRAGVYHGALAYEFVTARRRRMKAGRTAIYTMG